MKWRWAGSLNPREYGITKCAYVGVCIWKIHTVLEDSGELCLLNHPLSNDYQIHKSNTYFTWQVSACSAVTVHSVTSYLWDKEVKAQVSNAVSPLKRKKKQEVGGKYMSRFALTKGVCELSALLLKGQVLCVCERDSMLCLHMVRHQLREAAEQIYHRCSDRRAAQSR